MSTYHRPVMLDACLEGLDIKPDGIYVDVTFGGGGHSRAILEKLGDNGRLYGFDQDVDAQANILDDPRFKLIPQNFRHLKKYLRLEGIRKVDGILADLGVSSHQFDEAERGFSFRFDAELDMRMYQNQSLNARKVLEQYKVEQLQDILSRYGEVRNARTLAQAIVQERQSRSLATIADFLSLLDPLVRGERHRYLAQVFQALRMEVNDEENALKDLLSQCAEVLKPDARLVVLSYHSIEDRLVKNFIKTGNFDGVRETDFYGRVSFPFKSLHSKPVLPSNEEMKENSRARSAKYRVGVRTEHEYTPPVSTP